MTVVPSMMIFNRVGSQLRFQGNEGEPDQPNEGFVEYFRKRERAERAAAKKAQSTAARRAHQQLAEEYASIIRQAGQAPGEVGD